MLFEKQRAKNLSYRGDNMFNNLFGIINLTDFGVLAGITTIIVQILKQVFPKSFPTKLLTLIVGILVTVVFTIISTKITIGSLIGSIILGFVTSFASMNGFDSLRDIYRRFSIEENDSGDE